MCWRRPPPLDKLARYVHNFPLVPPYIAPEGWDRVPVSLARSSPTRNTSYYMARSARRVVKVWMTPLLTLCRMETGALFAVTRNLRMETGPLSRLRAPMETGVLFAVRLKRRMGTGLPSSLLAQTGTGVLFGAAPRKMMETGPLSRLPQPTRSTGTGAPSAVILRRRKTETGPLSRLLARMLWMGTGALSVAKPSPRMGTGALSTATLNPRTGTGLLSRRRLTNVVPSCLQVGNWAPI